GHSHHKTFTTRIGNAILSLIFLGLSFFFMAYGIVQICVGAAAPYGITSRNAWVFIVNGLFCLVVGSHGFFLLFHKRSSAFTHCMLNIILIVQAFVLFTIYSALLNRNIREICGGEFYNNPYCHHDREVYLGIALAIFWVINITVIPFSLICSIIHLRSVNRNKNQESIEN
ncbi:hypothetical protein DICPUDRAFT_21493, partial [Dictyostelium purpureum]